TAGPATDAAARRAAAADRTGIYLTAVNATPEKLPAYFDYIERHGFNSVVVDFKDDHGRLTYASELPTARAAGAVRPVINAAELVEAAHARGISVIARIVVFKDPILYAYDDHRLALWDGRLDRPWGVYRSYTDEETGAARTVQVEHWVDAYSPEVWEYNVNVAREVADLGVDEIQFDYIRFPSDGRAEDIVSRFAVPGANRVQALEGFLASARDAIDLPISIDVFGFNAWSRMSYLGQDITRLGRYVDVISPMFYPSHFVTSFLPQFGYLERARLIYDLGTRRAHELAPEPLIRPYVQAFLIGRELDFEEPTYRRYLDLQVEASLEAGSSGYTLWNASGRYYMLP
ncbi:MAG: putative glycoside hydrolase, partial [bacterium]